MQGKSSFIYGKLGKDSANIIYYPHSNIYSVENRLPMLSDTIDTHFEDVLWKFFKLSRSFKLYRDALFTPEMNYCLFVEPYRTCNLKCSYCYAQPSWESSEKLQYKRLKEVIDLYNIRDIRIFGGEPLVDSNMILQLFKDYPDRMFMLSSNGALLTDELITAFNSVRCSLQISLEPVEWGQRVNWNNKPQFELLETKWKLLNKLKKRPVFRLTIPTDKDIPYVSLLEFAERIAQKKGDWNFVLVTWPAFGDKLPVWFDRWIEEGHRILEDADLRWRMRDKHLWTSFLVRFEGFTSFPWYALNCNAGVNAFSIAPNGSLYACHEYAVVESAAYQLGRTELDKDKQFDIVSEYIKVINTNEKCNECDAKFLCGGICFSRNINSACEYMIRCLPLIMQWLPVALSREILGWELSTKKFKKRIEGNLQKFDMFLKEEQWRQFYSGELPKEKVQELGSILQGILGS